MQEKEVKRTYRLSYDALPKDCRIMLLCLEVAETMGSTFEVKQAVIDLDVDIIRIDTLLNKKHTLQDVSIDNLLETRQKAQDCKDFFQTYFKEM